MRSRLVAVVLVLVVLLGLGRIARDEIVAGAGTRASDALPLYLSAAAVADGNDPTREASLAAAYDAREMDVGAATFSTLYPATAGALLRPAASLTWTQFTTAWRVVMLAALAGLGVAGAGFALAGGASRAGAVAWGAGLVAALAWHPLAGEAVRLGQVNLVLAGLCALAMAWTVQGEGNGLGAGGSTPRNAPGRRVASFDTGGAVTAGALVAVGALLKLVPGALLVPWLVTRRWRPLAAAVAVGVAGLGLASASTPPVRIVEAIGETLRFQGDIAPDWLVGTHAVSGWMRVVGFLRHGPLQGVTLALAVLVPLARPSPRTAAAAMALVCAWLGADAAGFHVLYVPLAWPVLAWACGRPWVFVTGVGALWIASVPELGGVMTSLPAELRMVLAGGVAWALALAGMYAAAGEAPAAGWAANLARVPGFTGGAVACAGILCGLLGATAVPGEGPVAAPLSDAMRIPEGPGYIRPGARVPGGGAGTALGGGLDRAASTLAKPGTIRALQLYLRRAPVLWEGLAAARPDLAESARARVRAVPSGELRDLSGREVGIFLRGERAALTTMRARGVEVGAFDADFDAAWASGLGARGEGAPPPPVP